MHGYFVDSIIVKNNPLPKKQKIIDQLGAALGIPFGNFVHFSRRLSLLSVFMLSFFNR
jgi:hypothetical protein